MRAGICETQLKFECDVEWMKVHRVRGVVIWPRVMFSEKASDLPTWVFRHELQHAYQIMRDGAFMFYLKYFFYSLRYGYRDNPYEVDAIMHEYLPLTEREELWLWKLKEG